MKIQPPKQICRYILASSYASRGVDSRFKRRSVPSKSTTVRTIEIPINRTIELPIYPAIFFVSFAPRDLDIMTVVPMASPTSTTVSICMTCEPIDTADTVSAPLNCPAIKRSAIP